MTPCWHAELLGGLRVTAVGAGVSPGRVLTRFRSRRTASLLAYLACRASHPGPQSRELLVEQFWPEADYDAGRLSLRVALASLRRQLEPPEVPPGSVLVADRFEVGLLADAVSTDVARFEAKVRAATVGTAGAGPGGQFGAALNLYRGPLLPGFYEDWVLSERERLSRLFTAAALHQVQDCLAANDLSGATDAAERVLAAEPDDDEGPLLLMHLFLQSGHPGVAARLGQRLEARLAREERPPPTGLERLREAIRRARGTAEPPTGSSALAPSGASAPRAPEGGALPARPQATFAGDECAPCDPEATDAGGVWARTWTLLATDQVEDTRLAEVVRKFGGISLRHGARAYGRFAGVLDAADCAVALLQGRPEGGASPRLALFTGDARSGAGMDENSSAAPSQNLVARVERFLDLAQPGQILCSEGTAALLRTPEAADLDLQDLGALSLVGEPAPVRLFQVSAGSAGRGTFPLPADAVGYEVCVPHVPDRFFGREEELRRITESLWPGPGPEDRGAVRLLTLTGSGGAGKTRLALEAARRLAGPYRSEVRFVRCAAVSAPDAWLAHLAVALGQPVPAEAAVVTVARRLDGRPLLLVLDNLEHLVEGVGPVLAELLALTSSLRVLVTSRQPLCVRGERELLVRPLPVPDGPDRLSRLAACPSMQLLVDRAQAVAPEFQLTPQNAEVLAALCDGLEGLPLALELAAPRLAIQSPARLLESLGGRLDLLQSRRRDVEARHRTLRAAIAWSYDALAPELQRALADLTLFRGGWTLDAAEAVLDPGEPHSSAVELLAALVQASLVQADAGPGGRRFHMLDLVQAFAREHLSPERTEVVTQRLAGWAAERVASLAPAIRAADPGVFRIVDAEQANLLAALDCLRTFDPGLGLRMAVHLGQFWLNRGHWQEGLRWPSTLLECAPAVAPALRVRALIHASYSALHLGEVARAADLREAATAEWLAAGKGAYSSTADTDTDAESPSRLGAMLAQLGALIRFRAGDGSDAEREFRAAREQWETLGASRNVAFCRLMLGRILGHWDPEAAGQELRAALEIGQQLEHLPTQVAPLTELGHLAARAREWEGARDCYLEALACAEEIGDRGAVPALETALAFVALQRAERWEVRTRLRRSLDGMRALHCTLGLGPCLALLADDRLAAQDPEGAAVWCARAERVLPGGPEAADEWVGGLLEQLRRALGNGALARVARRGSPSPWEWLTAAREVLSAPHAAGTEAGVS